MPRGCGYRSWHPGGRCGAPRRWRVVTRQRDGVDRDYQFPLVAYLPASEEMFGGAVSRRGCGRHTARPGPTAVSWRPDALAVLVAGSTTLYRRLLRRRPASAVGRRAEQGRTSCRSSINLAHIICGTGSHDCVADDVFVPLIACSRCLMDNRGPAVAFRCLDFSRWVDWRGCVSNAARRD